MPNKSIEYAELYDLALDMYKGSVNMEESDFKRHLLFILQDMNSLNYDEKSDKLVTLDTNAGDLNMLAIPKDFEKLIQIDTDTGTPLFPEHGSRIVREVSNLYSKSKHYFYFNKSVKIVRFQYIINIRDVSVLGFPNEELYLESLILGCLWRYKLAELSIRGIGSLSDVKLAETIYIGHKKSIQARENILQFKVMINGII